MIDETVQEPVEEQRLAPARKALKFDRLLLDGFKSFAESTAIDIEPGLTGIVGPNGCGKSNLLESLRWVLGESSAKNMRGEGMDDVIFGGTDRRPARNVSEVSTILDNRLRTAPSGMNDEDELRITRRIERGQGTSYRVNGKRVLMKDVQLLFQDNASGARSSAIVSQGRVNALINAKASDRRSVLEEAAGVSGLSVRRNDFNNKLRGTETNLQRAEDSVAEVNNQVALLRKQARALQRWREFDQRIRTTTAVMLLSRWTLGKRSLADAEEAHRVNETRVTAAMLAAAEAARRREAALEALPALREQRTNADMDAVRANARLESIDNEADRYARELFEMQQRNLELTSDRAREDQSIAEARHALETKQDEQGEIAEIRSGEAEQMEERSDLVDAARSKVDAADAKVAEMSAVIATADAARASARRQREETGKRLEAVEQRLAKAEQALVKSKETLADDAASGGLSASVELLAERADALEEEAAAAEQAVEQTRTALDEANARAGALSSETAKLEAELEGLASIREAEASKAPVSASIRISPGNEIAVAAAFGDALSAGKDASEAAWWRAGADAASPFRGRRTLADVVSGVPELAAALAAVLLVDDDPASHHPLPMGTMAVALDGRFMRWDGYGGKRSGGQVEAALIRRARMLAISERIDLLRPDLEKVRASVVRATSGLADAKKRETDLKNESRATNERLRADRDALARLLAVGEEARRTVAVAEAEVRSVRLERQTALQDFGAAGDALAAVPEDHAAAVAVQQARAALQQARDAESASRIALERLTNEQNARRLRADTLMREVAEWSRRLQQATERRADLSRRYVELEKQLAEMEIRKATPAEAREEARLASETAIEAAALAARRLDAGETERNEAEESSRTIDASLATLREERARILGVLAQAQTMIGSVEAAVAEKLSATTQDLPTIAALPEGSLLPDPDIVEAQLYRLEADRQNFGAVNFLAEQELEEHDKRLGEMERGRQEIRDAIVKLRHGIAQIEDEARSKLEATFTTIDASFGKLFQTLFGGGHAHLKLVGDDILEAGLEIYASPPGKRMQVLSLLSGGEQTLTAMALIFAAFLSNPSPICVLDEADAALDDSNVDLLIRLVETMAKNDETRFLVVTHNPLTMARMDRLWGVTMAERGVSTATRVDMDKALQFVEES